MKKLSTASTIVTGTMTARSGLLRDAAFARIPSTKYAEHDPHRDLGEQVGEHVDRADPVERDDDDQGVDQDRHGAADPQPSGQHAVLTSPGEPPQGGAEDQRELEDRESGEDDGECEGEGHARSVPARVSHNALHAGVNSRRRRVHTAHDAAKRAFRSFVSQGSTSLRLPRRSR